MNPDGSDYIKTQVIGKGVVVAIDGPSGSGKSTVARQLAAEMDVKYLDTGAMYRALAWYVLEKGIDPANQEAVTAAADELPLRVEPFAHAPRFFVGDTNVTRLIRSEEVTNASSVVSQNIQVRAKLILRQREIIAEAEESGRGIVVEGRDITTVVAPKAHVRVLLTASPEERMRRRASELGAPTADVKSQTLDRDARDAAVTSFMSAAPGVVTIDSTGMTVAEVKDEIIALVRKALGIPLS